MIKNTYLLDMFLSIISFLFIRSNKLHQKTANKFTREKFVSTNILTIFEFVVINKTMQYYLYVALI